MSDNTRMRCDAPITIHMDSGIWGEYEHKTQAYLVEAALAVESVKHGKVSGMMSSVQVKYGLTLDDPSFELKDGQECPCSICEPSIRQGA